MNEQSPGQARVFALTGGIGSGKSTVSAVWRREGLPVVDADQLARRAVEPGTDALAQIEKRFGTEVLRGDGSLDRKALARLVFDDAARREELNAIVHPEVRRLAGEEFAAAGRRGEAWVAYEIPLLFETGQQGAFRPVVVVAASEAQQLERVRRRDGSDPSAVAARIAAQFPLATKVAGADYVIENDRDLEALEKRAREVLAQIRAS